MKRIISFLLHLCFPYITVFWAWYKKKWSTGIRIAFTLWAVLALSIIATGKLHEPVPTTPTPAPTPSVATSTTPAPSSAATNVVSTPTTPPPPAQNADDVAYLNAVNSIANNTFVEASNVGDQINQAGAKQISFAELADFMDTDVTLWKQYIAKIQPTKPADPFLIVTRQGILDNLNQLETDAGAMQQAATASDANKLVTVSQDFLQTLNHIKQSYIEAVSQMDKIGIKSTWTSN